MTRSCDHVFSRTTKHTENDIVENRCEKTYPPPQQLILFVSSSRQKQRNPCHLKEIQTTLDCTLLLLIFLVYRPTRVNIKQRVVFELHAFCRLLRDRELTLIKQSALSKQKRKIVFSSWRDGREKWENASSHQRKFLSRKTNEHDSWGLTFTHLFGHSFDCTCRVIPSRQVYRWWYRCSCTNFCTKYPRFLCSWMLFKTEPCH
jgi:hypothetical protein